MGIGGKLSHRGVFAATLKGFRYIGQHVMSAFLLAPECGDCNRG